MKTLKITVHAGEELENMPLTVGEHSVLKLKTLKVRKITECYEVQFESDQEITNLEEVVKVVNKRIATKNNTYLFEVINPF